jgi:hypothetical protein
MQRRLEAGATAGDVGCYRTGASSPSAVLGDTFLLFEENGMTEHLQERLKSLLEFDTASIDQFLSTQSGHSELNSDPNMMANLKRSSKARSEAEQLQSSGDPANALLMAEDSAVLYGTIRAHIVCKR